MTIQANAEDRTTEVGANGSHERRHTLNVYTQVLDGSLRAVVDKVGDGLFTIVHQPEMAGSLTH